MPSANSAAQIPSSHSSSSAQSSSVSSEISLASLLPNQLIHCTTFMTLHEEIQFEQTNRLHRSFLHYGHASTPSSRSSSSSSSSSMTLSSYASQLQQAQAHHRRVCVNAIMQSFTLYCDPTDSSSSCSSFSSSASSTISPTSSVDPSLSAAFESTRQLNFWNCGPGFREYDSFIPQCIDYNVFPPEWLIPTQCGIVITRDMIACQSNPEAELRTPINVVGIGIAVEEEVERQKLQVLSDQDHIVESRETCENTASQGYRNALAQLREYQQQQQQSNVDQPRLTLGQVGVQLTKKATPAYETEMRLALSSWSSSELRYLLHALQQYSKVRSVFADHQVRLDYPLNIPGDEANSATDSYVSLRRPMFVLCRWPSPLTGSRDDTRPANAPPRLSQSVATIDETSQWSYEECQDEEFYQILLEEVVNVNHRPCPFFSPSGVDDAADSPFISLPDRIARLSSLLRSCPWPLQQESLCHQENHTRRALYECRTAAHYLVESSLRVIKPMNAVIYAHLPQLGLPPYMRTEQPPNKEIFRARYGEVEGAGWRRVATQSDGQQLAESACQVLDRALLGAFLVQFGRAHLSPFPMLTMAPIAPGWVLAIVGGGNNPTLVLE